MSNDNKLLSSRLVEQVLDKLDINRPAPDLCGLDSLYRAWCQNIPFDNSLKLIDVQANTQRPLPGSKPDTFFENWLRWGSGGTCWSGNGGLCALLSALGFDAIRGVSTMLVAPHLPPNHGTVIVHIENHRYLVDASMLHGEPLLLPDANASGTHIDNPAWGVRARFEGEHFTVNWLPLHMPDGLDCRIDYIDATLDDFEQRYESTRGWSPFNYELNMRVNKGDRVVGIAMGQRVEIDADGKFHTAPLNAADRISVMVEELGVHPDLAARVPADTPTPPPPGSQTALRESGASA